MYEIRGVTIRPSHSQSIDMAPSTGISIFAAALLAGGAALASFSSSPTYHGVLGSNSSASALIDSSIRALGGREALSSLKSVTYESDRQVSYFCFPGWLRSRSVDSCLRLFRVRTIMQNYNLFNTDRFVVSAGSQNVSFSFHEEGFSHRIDRTFLSSGTLFPHMLYLFC